MRARVWAAAAGLCAAIGMTGAARAGDLIQFTFRGLVEEVEGASPVMVGEPFEFRYVFDAGTPDADPAPNFGLYPAIVDATARAGAQELTATAGDISVLNNGFAGDSYSGNVQHPIGFAIVNMTDFSFNAFTSDALPTNLNLAEWDVTQFVFHRDVGPTFWEAKGRVLEFEREIVGCYPDCDGNQQLNVNDYICFQTKFALGDPYADCDGNGVRNVNDYICFQTKFALGC